MNSYEKRRCAVAAKAVVGVDAGKFEHTLVVRPQTGPDAGRDSKPVAFKTTREGFERAAERILALAGPGVAPREVLVGIEFAGTYGFTWAHYLHARGFQIVSVLPAHTKKWKEVMHNQALKTDAKDALGITDLLAQGHFVSFPFLQTCYAELRYLVSARERLALLRRAALTRLKSTLHVVFPEFESVFTQLHKRTALAVLAAYPGPDVLLAAPKRKVLALLKKESRGHHGEARYEALVAAARATLALPGAQGSLKDEVPLLVELIETYERQIASLEAGMARVLETAPEAAALLSIPGVAPVSAAVFLGSIGDPQAYESSRQILKIAGLSLVERSSGILKGQKRISKRGRPTMRHHAYMFAVRSVKEGGIFRDEFLGLVARNGGKKIPALTAVSRSALKLMFRIAKERRAFTPAPPAPPVRLRATVAHDVQDAHDMPVAIG